MQAIETAKAAPARCGGDLQNAMLGGSQNLNSAGRERDQRLLRFDFLAETGEIIVSLGAALITAASAENLPLVEMILRQMRAALIEGISEFRELSPEDSPE